MELAVIGAGSWGTALAHLLSLKGNTVHFWAHRESVAQFINVEHRNPDYLSNFSLSENIIATSSIKEACQYAEAVVVVTPSKVMREIAQNIKPYINETTPIIICSKGAEANTGKLPIEIFADELKNPSRLAVLSGPNHAEEVVQCLPAATVVASIDQTCAQFFQELFACDYFRTYASLDVLGVELCAAFKNIIAIAVGISYGLGFGDNTAALLMTRGIAEMSRLVSAIGGEAITCMGLAGTGDLIATCTSQHSRNRRFGEDVAKGKTLEDFQGKTHMVVEGALACKTIQTLADRYEVDLPITQKVRAIVWEGSDTIQAAEELADRPLTTEFRGL